MYIYPGRPSAQQLLEWIGSWEARTQEKHICPLFPWRGIVPSDWGPSIYCTTFMGYKWKIFCSTGIFSVDSWTMNRWQIKQNGVNIQVEILKWTYAPERDIFNFGWFLCIKLLSCTVGFFPAILKSFIHHFNRTSLQKTHLFLSCKVDLYLYLYLYLTPPMLRGSLEIARLPSTVFIGLPPCSTSWLYIITIHFSLFALLIFIFIMFIYLILWV